MSSSSITIKILSIVQHEFPSKHLYKSKLIKTLHDWDNKNRLDSVVLYSTKAFDIVPHDKLLGKIKHYGIN